MRFDDDPIAENLSQIISRVRYIQQVDADKGYNRGREAERLALVWALEELAAAYPGAGERAVEIADDRDAWRAQRAARVSS